MDSQRTPYLVSKGHRQTAVVLAGMIELFKLYSGRDHDLLTDLWRGKAGDSSASLGNHAHLPCDFITLH